MCCINRVRSVTIAGRSELGDETTTVTQVCAAEINSGSSSAVAVIDGLGGSRVDINAKDRHLIVLSGTLVGLLGCGILREDSDREHHAQKRDESNIFHNAIRL